MKKMLIAWFEGASYILWDEYLISYYAYFTMVLAEIAYLWACMPEIALPFTVLLSLCLLNVVLCSYLKGWHEGEALELYAARGYAIAFGLIFAAGMFFNWKANIILFILPFAGTWLCAAMRMLEVGVLSVLAFLLPMSVFSACLWLNEIPVGLKLVIFVAYLICAPLFEYIEDSFAVQNIFALAFEVTFKKD